MRRISHHGFKEIIARKLSSVKVLESQSASICMDKKRRAESCHELTLGAAKWVLFPRR